MNSMKHRFILEVTSDGTLKDAELAVLTAFAKRNPDGCQFELSPYPHGYICQECRTKRPPDWFWYTITKDDGEVKQPCCALCARQHKSQGPFKQPFMP